MKMLRIGLLFSLTLVILTLPNLASALLTSDQAVDQIEQTLLPDGRDAVVLKVWGPIPTGTPIRSTRELLIIAPADGYAIYIDDSPTANLFHAVRYAFVNAATGELITASTLYPPANEEQYDLVSTSIGERLMAATNYRPVASSPYYTPPPTRADRWAVLMNGGYNSSNNHVRYWNDLSNIYCTLVQVYGYADDHIIVLCSDGLNPAPDQSNGLNSDPDLDNDGDDDIMYSCVLSNVDMVFGWLAQNLQNGDQLFVFTTDHGGPVSGWQVIENLWNMEELTDAHFAQLIGALPEGVTVAYTLEPCNSGGFMDDLIVPALAPIVGSSACAYNESSWAMPPDYVYDTYVFHWTAAVNGHDAYGVAVDADYNNDGVVMMDEAFRYAQEHDQSAETPQYGDQPVGLGAGVSLWPMGTGPFLVVSNSVLDDIGGNNNGMPDPGENISLAVTLNNVGNGTASNIVGTLSTTDPYVTITQNSATFPNLAHFQQGPGSQAYLMSISTTCPEGHATITTLHITADSGYTNNVNISFIVGDIRNQPTGPDQYGYKAYDNHDGPNCFPFNWVEIAPAAGGPGTAVTALIGQDDRSTLLTLPFTFRYYGQDFTQLTICTNGWLAMGNATPDSDWSNSAIPNADGPPNMLAPFWEDMNLETSGQIASYNDAANHRFIVEFYRVPQFTPATALETFEVILLDPAYYTTPTGDGKVVFQYGVVSDPSSCTVGIENQTETTGIQYLLDGTYDIHAWTLEAGRSICFLAGSLAPNLDVTLTPTNPPIVIPANGGSFNFTAAVMNSGPVQNPFYVWARIKNPDGTYTNPVLGPVQINPPVGVQISRQRTQNVPGAWPSGLYTYLGYANPTVAYPAADSASFTFTKSTTADGGPVVENSYCYGELFPGEVPVAVTTPLAFELKGAFPNPFNPTTAISYQLAAISHVNLKVYDTAGRLITTLADDWQEAGTHKVTFDGSKFSSGLYFVRMQAGDFSAVSKMMLVK